MCSALLLRFYKLGVGPWVDEILTWVNYMHLPFSKIVITYNDQNNHIFYTLLAKVSFMIFGESTWSLRLPAVFFGAGSIWALFLFGREVTNDLEALISCIVFRRLRLEIRQC